jgi:hypothetical protein
VDIYERSVISLFRAKGSSDSAVDVGVLLRAVYLYPMRFIAVQIKPEKNGGG